MWAVCGACRRDDRAAARRRCTGTLVDAVDVDDVVRLVRIGCGRRGGSEHLVTTIVRLLMTFLPNERVLRRLSLMQQRVAGSGGREEYAVLTVFALAQEMAPDLPRYAARAPYVALRRCNSTPCFAKRSVVPSHSQSCAGRLCDMVVWA